MASGGPRKGGVLRYRDGRLGEAGRLPPTSMTERAGWERTGWSGVETAGVSTYLRGDRVDYGWGRKKLPDVGPPIGQAGRPAAHDDGRTPKTGSFPTADSRTEADVGSTFGQGWGRSAAHENDTHGCKAGDGCRRRPASEAHRGTRTTGRTPETGSVPAVATTAH
jgi:hypothetical protein